MSTPTLKQNTLREGTRILGIGAYRPNVIVTNADVCQWIDSSDEWIQQRTGRDTWASRDSRAAAPERTTAPSKLESSGTDGWWAVSDGARA